MAKVKEKLAKLIPTKRKLIQLYFALLYNANLKGFISGSIYKGDSKSVCVPGLNCYSCPGAVGACPLGSLQSAVNADKSTMFYMLGILMLFGVLFGRLICGFACPFGLVQELLYKIKTPKLKKSKLTWALSFLKYAILVVFVLVIPIAYAVRDVPLPAFCKYICPAGTLEGGIGLLANKMNEGYFTMLGPIFTWKFALLVSITVGSVFVFRLFCRFMCPLGLIYGLFNRFSVFGIRLEGDKCVECGLCVNKCKMDIRRVGDIECINCGECIDVCPTKAISFKGSSISLMPNEIPDTGKKKNKKSVAVRCVTVVLMLTVLFGVYAYFWNEKSPIPAVGTEVGDACFSYELETFDENGLTGEKIDATKTGKITIINFWGTWCTPCVNELPCFDEIAKEYGESVCVIAVHTAMPFDNVPEYVGKYYKDSSMVFAKDYRVENMEGYYTNLGGDGSYPYTVVLDNNGVIAKMHLGSLTYEELKADVDELLKNG